MRRGFFQSTTVRLALALLLAQVAALALGLTVIHRFTAATILADARTAAEVARELRVAPEWTQGYLSRLAAGGILRERAGRAAAYVFAPVAPSTSDTVSRLARAYARQRHTVIELIYSEPDDEICTFADAFTLWKRK